MQKENYEIPMVEIIEFETEDIITTSGGDDEIDINTGLPVSGI